MNELYSEQIKYTHISKENKLFSFLVVIMMLGSIYLFPFFKSIDMGELLVLLCIPYFVGCVRRLTISKAHNLIYIFIGYSLITSVLMCILMGGDMGAPVVRIMRDLFYYTVIFCIGYLFFDMKSFKKYLVLFSVVLSAFVILQVLVYKISDYMIPGFLMSASLNDGGYTGAQLYADLINYANVAGYLKPNGFLCEPAHCAQCLFVAILVLLFSENHEKNDLKYAIIISVGMVLTMSTSAMLYLMFAWGVWCIKEGKKNFLKVFVLVLVAIIIALIAINKGQLDNVFIVIRRFTNLITGDSVTNSSQLRMLKGFSVFNELPILQQIFGIGFGNYTAALALLANNTSVVMLENEYMNTVAYILVSSGIIGSILMSLFFTQIYRRSLGIGRIMIVALLIMSLGSSIYSSPIWIWMMLIILYSNREVQ